MLRQIAAGEETSLEYSPSWLVASCRHRFRARKNPGPAVHSQILRVHLLGSGAVILTLPFLGFCA